MSTIERYAFMLTLLAGLATLLGSLIALFAKRTNTKLLAGSLGFSAGVMIYVAMAELFVKSKDYLVDANGEFWGSCGAALAFFGGIRGIGIGTVLVTPVNGTAIGLFDKLFRSRMQTRPLFPRFARLFDCTEKSEKNT